jgi:hypothetical protein
VWGLPSPLDLQTLLLMDDCSLWIKLLLTRSSEQTRLTFNLLLSSSDASLRLYQKLPYPRHMTCCRWVKYLFYSPLHHFAFDLLLIKLVEGLSQLSVRSNEISPSIWSNFFWRTSSADKLA